MPLPPGVHLTNLVGTSTTASMLAMATSDLFQIATVNPTYPSPTLASATLASSITTATSLSPSDEPKGTGECSLLGPFAILIQGALGALALLSLVYKRWRERPQRPVKIWAFDASKQVVGSILLHLANLVMSMFSAGQVTAALAAVQGTPYQPNPCSFYLLNLAIDTTIGIPILIVLLRLFHAAFRLTPLANPPESIQSGNYGSPPRYTWWMKQSLIYFLGLLGMKFCVFMLFVFFPWLGSVGDWALRWTEGNEAIQIAFVMLIFPLIMNALQYYIIDTFIKKRDTSKDSDVAEDAQSRDSSSSSIGADERGGLLAGTDEHGEPIDTHADYDTSTTESKAKVNPKRPASAGTKELKTSKFNSIQSPVGRDSSSSSSQPSPRNDPPLSLKKAKRGDGDEARNGDEDEDLLERTPKPTE